MLRGTEMMKMNLAFPSGLRRTAIFTFVAVIPAIATSTHASANERDRNAEQERMKSRIESGLEKLGLDSGCEIVIADSSDMVENTAAEELKKFLGKAEVSAAIVPESKSTGIKRFFLGRVSRLKAIKSFEDKGDISIRNVSAEDDGFHLKQVGQDFVVAGANPRGVLYGVYAFEDFVNDGANGVLDIKKIPYFRKRGNGPFYCSMFNRYINLFTEDFPEEKAAYLSRMGINQLTDQGIGGNLHNLVRCDVFTFLPPPQPDFQRKVKAMSALCKKYGIDQYLWIYEPVLAVGLEKYPKEALGTVNPPYGGMCRTLCVNSPIVQKHLRDMMGKLVREYPDVKGVQFYNLDGGAWLCTPGLCERCKTVCQDSPPNEHTPWETQAKLVTLLADAAHEVNADFDFKFWGAVHYHGERFDKMIHAAQGYNSLFSSWNASDRGLTIPDNAERDPAFVISQKVCKERAIPLYILHEYNNLECVPRSLPFPFHVCDALKKIKRWDVKYLTEIFGLIPEHNAINTLVMKEFQWNPDQSPKKFLASLSVRQFGESAGTLMYRAWEEMERAFDVWNDMEVGPLSGSQHHLSIGTTVALPGPILPHADAGSILNDVCKILTDVEPWRSDEYQKWKSLKFLDKMKRMNAHLARAAEQANQAIAASSDKEFIDLCYYEGPSGRPTRKEYAELNHGPIAIADALCQQRVNMLRAYHLLTEIENARAAGDEKSAREKEEQYLQLIREDLGVQERFCELLADLAKRQPCYTRTGMTDGEIADLLSVTRAKIEELKAFLATKEPKSPQLGKRNSGGSLRSPSTATFSRVQYRSALWKGASLL